MNICTFIHISNVMCSLWSIFVLVLRDFFTFSSISYEPVMCFCWYVLTLILQMCSFLNPIVFVYTVHGVYVCTFFSKVRYVCFVYFIIFKRKKGNKKIIFFSCLCFLLNQTVRSRSSDRFLKLTMHVPRRFLLFLLLPSSSINQLTWASIVVYMSLISDFLNSCFKKINSFISFLIIYCIRCLFMFLELGIALQISTSRKINFLSLALFLSLCVYNMF